MCLNCSSCVFCATRNAKNPCHSPVHNKKNVSSKSLLLHNLGHKVMCIVCIWCQVSLLVGASFRNNGGFGGVVRRRFFLVDIQCCVCVVCHFTECRCFKDKRQQLPSVWREFAPTLCGEHTCCSASACQFLAVCGPEDCLRSFGPPFHENCALDRKQTARASPCNPSWCRRHSSRAASAHPELQVKI